MMISMKLNDKKLIKVLGMGGIAVIPTDTLYGIVGSARSVTAVSRIYDVRKRNPKKPAIILLGDTDELKKFSIILSDEQKRAIKKYWPGPVSIVLDCSDETLSYLHRGVNSLAFRVPFPQPLRNLLRKAGPLIAPSANTEGKPPAQNIAEAKKYFGDSVDLYIDGGELKGKASTMIKLHDNGSVTVLRA